MFPCLRDVGKQLYLWYSYDRERHRCFCHETDFFIQAT
jgi:hypothetical protein